MLHEYHITQAAKDEHIHQILALQQINLARSLPQSEVESEGFVTCEHDFALLLKMNYPDGHVIAVANKRVVGYCLVMAPNWRNEVEVIRSMFEKIESADWKGRPISSKDYVVMGQVCISKEFRRKGVFRAMYQHFREVLHSKYQYCITEVATSNTRSLEAHTAVGFQNLLSYAAPDGKSWELIIWDWQ